MSHRFLAASKYQLRGKGKKGQEACEGRKKGEKDGWGIGNIKR